MHNELIKALGGSGKVSKTIGLNQSTVSMWRERGIAWRYRPMIAEMARKAKIELPDGFLDPGLREAA